MFNDLHNFDNFNPGYDVINHVELPYDNGAIMSFTEFEDGTLFILDDLTRRASITINAADLDNCVSVFFTSESLADMNEMITTTTVVNKFASILKDATDPTTPNFYPFAEDVIASVEVVPGELGGYEAHFTFHRFS